MERRITGTCTDYNHEGKGVVRHQDLVLFIPDLLIGEQAEILITIKRQNYYEGRVLKRLNDSPQRVKPPCPYYETCGGCQLQHMAYQEQLKMKKMRVAEVLRRVGGYNDPTEDVIPMDNPWHYRHKIQLPFGLDDDGNIIAGLYQVNSHQIVNIDECLIENGIAKKILKTIRQLMVDLRIMPFDVRSQEGTLRYVLIRKAYRSSQTMVVLITSTLEFPGREMLVKRLYESHPEIVTVVQNINPERTNVVLGEKERILGGPGYYEDEIQGIKFRISSKSFFQVNPEQTEKLYAKALQLANIQPTDLVLDAYSGVGTMTLLASQLAKHVTGVEIVEEATKNAIENAKLNLIKNVSFITADAGQYLQERMQKGKTYDVLLVDPPRQGLNPAFVYSLIKTKPNKVVYVSCDPSTLARDLKMLQQIYDVKVVQPVDMFSQTYHIETVVLLQLKPVE